MVTYTPLEQWSTPTPQSRVILENILVAFLVNKFLAYYGNPKFYYLTHESPPLVHILSHTNPVCKTTPYFFKIYFSITFPSTPRSSKWFLPFKFCD
jgi:hypothetical protein